MKKMKLLGNMAMMALGISGIAVSCKNGKSENIGDISFETYDFSTLAIGVDADSIKAEDENYSGVWSVKSEGVLPVKADDYDMAQLRDTLCRLAGIGIAEDHKIEARLPEYLKISEEKLDSAKAASMLVRRISLEFMTPQVMVFQVYSYQYPEGAAHGGYGNRYVNFDLLKGRVLTQKDVFAAGYQPKLEVMIREKVADMPDLIVDIDEVGIPANFRFTDEGITFVYSIYEIAPYSSGEPEVAFNYAELKDILNPDIQPLFY